MTRPSQTQNAAPNTTPCAPYATLAPITSETPRARCDIKKRLTNQLHARAKCPGRARSR